MHEERHLIDDRGTTTGQISLLYKLLADHRRVLLQYLRDTEAPMPISALVTELTQSDDRDPSTGTTDTEIALHHIHLPKLAETRIIEYDQSAQQATYTAPP